MYNSGRRGKRANDGYGILSQADRFNQTEYPIPIVTSFAVTDGSYVPLDDTAASTAGGQTIVVYGSGFAPGATIMVGGSTIGSVTYLDQGRLTFTSPSNVSGSYTIIVMNANGGTGILVPGLVYSGVPTWSTSAGSVGSVYETTNVSSTFVATGDAPVTYSVLSGSLPPGTSLSTTGVLTGSAPVESGSTTYSFTIRATDGQLQDSDRSFSLTVNTDVVSWSTPTNNQVISAYEYAPISNVTASATSAAGYGVVYSANAVPTGITVNANTGVISGTVNTVGNTFTRLTATANTTVRTAIRDVVFNINPDVVTWNSPANGTSYTLTGGSPISNVTLSATSAAGFGVQYTANALPSGLTLSGSTISGTPTTAQTVNTLLTATANTTNRTAIRTISWTISLGDLNWTNTTLALNAITTVSPFITDSSNNNAQLIVGADARASNFNPYQQGYYSLFNDGTGQNATVGSGSTAFNLTGDFTLEAWVYPTSFAGDNWGIIDARTAGASPTNWVWSLEDQGTEQYKIMFYSGGFNRSTGQSISANRWTHVAVVRNGSALRYFVNGVLDYHNGSFGTAALSPGSTTPVIGSKDSGMASYKTAGYVSNLRLVNGTAVYTTSATTIGTSVFTPSTTPLTAVANTTLLTCQDNRYIDDSPNNFTITPGSASAIRIVHTHPFATPTTVAYNNQYSVYFDGTGDYLTAPNNSNLSLGTGDFTIEMWAWFNDAAGRSEEGLIETRTSGPGTNQYLLYKAFGSTSLHFYTSSTNVITGTLTGSQRWNHIAIVRSSGTTRMYINGTQSGGNYTDTNNYTVSGPTYIGCWYGLDKPFNGYISNLRLVKGTALYTSSFTPPTEPLSPVTNTQLLTCQNATLIDNSTNAFTITSAGQAQPIALSPFTMTTSNTTVTSLGSAYFDGTGDFIRLPASSNFSFPGDYTVEFWVYFLSSSGDMDLVSNYVSNVGTDWIIMRPSGANFQYYPSSAASLINGPTPIINRWYHVAAVRSGTTCTLYVDGVSFGSLTFSGTLGDATKSLFLGSRGGGTANFLNGYMSDVRITKTALYRSNFAPPLAPATPVANTQLLTVQTNGAHNNSTFKDESTFSLPITRNGNVTQGTFSPYGDNFSTYFNGSSDYLYCSMNAIGTNSFTIESWVYFNTVSSQQMIIDFRPGGTNGAYPTIYIDSSGILYYFTNTGARITGPALSANRWYHIAVSRSGTSTKMFLDGLQVGSTYSDSTNYLSSSNRPVIGSNSSAGAGPINGHISNLRVLVGTGLYTANVAPPTAPLTAVANTQLLTCNTNRFNDNSPNNLSITTAGTPTVQKFSPFGTVTVPKFYSTFFDGTGDSLSVPTNTGLQLTGDFTVEAWIYMTTINTYNMVFGADNGANSDYFGIRPTTIELAIANAAYPAWSFTFATGVWYHVAVTRSSNTLRAFVNGTQLTLSSGSATNSSQYFQSAAAMFVGRYGGTTPYSFTGNISNARIVKGTALYTSNFTPSTTPLTAVANTSLLTCQDNTFVDNSTNNLLITAAGDVKPLAVSPFTPTANTGLTYGPATFGGSMYFDGVSDWLATTANPAYHSIPANGSYTIEGWFYFTDLSITQQTIFTQRSSASQYVPYLIWTNTTSIVLYVSSNNGSWNVRDQATLATGLVTNQWYHFAFTKNNTTFRFFVNGVQTYTFTDASVGSAFTNTNPINIGMSPGETNTALKGYVSDYRFINGTSLYNANFAPPPTPLTPVVYSNNSTTIANTVYSSLLVTGEQGGIIDQTRTVDLETVGDVKIAPENPFESGFYSNFFDGTGDFLTTTVPAIGTGDFTIEGWVYSTGATSNRGIFHLASSNWPGTISGLGLAFFGDSSSFTWLYGGTQANGGSTPVNNVWYHFAMCRSGTSLRGFLNGVQVLSVSDSTNYTQTALMLGGYFSNTILMTGHMSNFRVLRGTALYTSAFTPPTSPLAAVANTQLLTCQSNSFIDNSTNNLTITRNGDVAVRSFNPFKRNTGQSYFFDGTGDYLDIPSSPSFSQTGAWTVEMWIYPTVSNNCYLYSQVTSNFLQINLTGSMTINIDRSGVGNIITSSHTAPIGVWTHVALVSDGTNMRLFMNGVQSGATAAVGTQATSATTTRIGAYQNAGSAGTLLYYGYIDDLRITRGVARYTANNQVNLTSTFEVK